MGRVTGSALERRCSEPSARRETCEACREMDRREQRPHAQPHHFRHTRLHRPRASRRPRRRAHASGRCLQPRRHPLRSTNGPPTVPRRTRPRRHPRSRRKPRAQTAHRPAPRRSRPGNHLRQMPGARPTRALPRRQRFSRRSRALAGRPTDCGTASFASGASLALVEA